MEELPTTLDKNEYAYFLRRKREVKQKLLSLLESEGALILSRRYLSPVLLAKSYAISEL